MKDRSIIQTNKLASIQSEIKALRLTREVFIRFKKKDIIKLDQRINVLKREYKQYQRGLNYMRNEIKSFPIQMRIATNKPAFKF